MRAAGAKQALRICAVFSNRAESYLTGHRWAEKYFKALLLGSWSTAPCTAVSARMVATPLNQKQRNKISHTSET